MTARPYAIGSDHFPGLSKLSEELGELQQVLGKILGCGGYDHWDGDLAPRLHDEMGDVRAALKYFEMFNLDADARFDEWHDEGDPLPT